MKHLVRVLLVAAALLPELLWSAERPTVKASFVPDSIAIGDQFMLSVEVEKDVMQVVGFPNFEQNGLVANIEVLQDLAPDTVKLDNRRERILKRYLLTCFDAGIYAIGSFPVLYLDKNIVDTLHSADTLRLLVQTFPIDTLSKTIYDIKPPVQAPLKVGEFSGYTLMVICLIAIIAAITYLVVVTRKRHVAAEKSKPTEPAHVIAIRDLEELNNQKVWQSNRHKHYYTRLTDIIRTYLDNRYGVSAMEMTSDEIMEAMSRYDLSPKSSDDMRTLLREADLVKFAKHIPSPEQNENSWYAAYYFVEETKEIPQKSDPEAQTEENNQQQ